jgi:parallel beta-helix repeat protein
MSTRFTRFAPVSAAALIAAGGVLLAGPLDPPAGPVSPTYKTLAEVEPRIAINAANTPGDADSLFRITQRGSYYLTGNITGALGKMGIEIAASGVRIDLNGFDLQGVPGSLDGIATSVSPISTIEICNGSIRAWSGDGIDLQTVFSTNTVMRDVRAGGNSGFGIRAANSFVFERCSAIGNGAGGFASSVGGRVIACEALSNTGTGMLLGQGVSVIDSMSSSNIGAGSDGIVIGGFGGVISGCTAKSNDGNGIVLQNGSAVTVSDCSVGFNDFAGIQAASGSSISRCSVNFNQTFNIIATDECTIENCTIGLGNQGGIQCGTRCVIRGNSLNRNSNGSATGPNILVTGADNRVEANNCTGAFRGIKVDAAGNFIARNTCSGNSANYELVAGNVCLVVIGATSGAILGSAGGVAPGSADPNANFSY